MIDRLLCVYMRTDPFPSAMCAQTFIRFWWVYVKKKTRVHWIRQETKEWNEMRTQSPREKKKNTEKRGKCTQLQWILFNSHKIQVFFLQVRIHMVDLKLRDEEDRRFSYTENNQTNDKECISSLQRRNKQPKNIHIHNLTNWIQMETKHSFVTPQPALWHRFFVKFCWQIRITKEMTEIEYK